MGSVEADDPLAEIADPYDLDEAFDEPDGYESDRFDPDDDDPPVYDDPYQQADPIYGSEPVLLVWSQPEYEQVDQRWPEVLEPIGAESWDDYRRHYQAVITRWARAGRPPLSLVHGTADGFAAWLVEQGVDPLTGDLVAQADRYGDHLADQGGAVELPPEPDDPCWCGSGARYQQCCRPLSPR